VTAQAPFKSLTSAFKRENCFNIYPHKAFVNQAGNLNQFRTAGLYYEKYSPHSVSARFFLGYRSYGRNKHATST